MNNSCKSKGLYNWIVIVSFVCLLLILFSCSNSSNKDFKDEKIDIPITINLGHTEDLDMRQLVDAEYEIKDETDADVCIDINSEYYKKYMSGKRFKASQLAVFENSENVENLILDLDIVNNSDKRLSINELDVVVDKSEPDDIPIIYICTTEDYSNCIYFVNESWFNWKGFTFSYSILKKGESFNGKYKKKRHISYFDDFLIFDLLPDMKEMGYDFDGLVNSIRKWNAENQSNSYMDIDPLQEEEGSYKYLCFYIEGGTDKDFRFFQDKFKPFELGVATLYGSLKFDDIDFKVDFIADISLSTSGGFGALSYVNDEFDVKLKVSGENYKLRYPYTTVVEPYGSEFIKLRVVADKSSKHKFYINIKNDNNLNIRSKNIHFHNYYPKN